MEQVNSEFTEKLLQWDRTDNKRKMPWKGIKNPYKIWLSEIILQQTRVEQGLPYFQRFIKEFPTIKQLANASTQKVFKLWEGLGYYSRCRNLIETAGFISNNLNGKFPDTYPEILRLKGVGPYTAAAIASFAFNLPHAVVDGNVFRVLARYFGIKKDTASNSGKKYFSKLADDLLDKKNPGEYNQAIMDFGATVCKPANALCYSCPLQLNCAAYNKKMVGKLPVKIKKKEIKTRHFHFLVISDKKRVLIRERTDKDIWKHLYEFPLIEMNKKTDVKKVLTGTILNLFGITKENFTGVIISGSQKLSHQTIHACFYLFKTPKITAGKGFQAVDFNHLSNFAFPKIINEFVKSKPFSAKMKADT